MVPRSLMISHAILQLHEAHTFFGILLSNASTACVCWIVVVMTSPAVNCMIANLPWRYANALIMKHRIVFSGRLHTD